MAIIERSNVIPEIKGRLTFTNAGAPTVNVTALGQASVGDLLRDTTNGVLYQCSATDGSTTITWVKVGTET